MLRRNVIANYLGKGISSLVSLACIPLYLRLLGPDAWGLVAFYLAVQTILPMLDLGLKTTLNRELAQRQQEGGERAAEARHLVRSLELLYGSVALLIVLAMFVLAPFLVQHWLTANHMPHAEIIASLHYMGLAMALQFAFDFYAGGLQGLQKQVPLNILITTMGLVRTAATLLALYFIARLPQVFLITQSVCFGLQMLLAARMLWNYLPAAAERPGMRLRLLRQVRGFAMSMTWISILSVFNGQADSLFISRLLPLSLLGYYNIARQAMGAVSLSVNPIFNAVFPAFSACCAGGDTRRLAETYHRSCQTLHCIALSTGALLVFFPRQVLWAWTGSSALADRLWLVMALLAAGSCLNAVYNLPYALQLAWGWTSLPLVSNLLITLLEAPLLWFAVKTRGLIGAAFVWFLVNALLVPAATAVMHTRILKGEQRTWLLHDLLSPLAGICAVFCAVRLLLPAHVQRPLMLLLLASAWGLALVCGALCSPHLRKMAHILYQKAIKKPLEP